MTRRRGKRRPRDIDQPITDLATHPTETVTPKVLAENQRCDVRTIIRMIEEGALVGYKVGREWRVTTESVRAAFKAHRQDITAAALDVPHGTDTGAHPRAS